MQGTLFNNRENILEQPGMRESRQLCVYANAILFPTLERGKENGIKIKQLPEKNQLQSLGFLELLVLLGFLFQLFKHLG